MRFAQDAAPTRGSFPRFYLASISARLVVCWARAGGKPSLQKGPQIQIKKIQTVPPKFSPFQTSLPLEVIYFCFNFLV